MDEVVFIKTDTLRKNPRNIEWYGDSPEPGFVEKVRKFGIRCELRLASDGITIIGGHRRWQAAKIVGLKLVPCIITNIPPDPQHPDFIEAALLDNENREKTVEEKAREFESWKEIESKRASKSSLANLKQNAASTEVENLPPRENIGKTADSSKAKSRDKAAAKVGMSGKTAEKAAAVVAVIDTLSAAGQVEEAASLRDKLNNKSVSAAHREVEGSWDAGDEPDATPRPSVSAYFDAKEKRSAAVKKTHFDDSQHDKLFGPLMRFYQARAEVKRCVNGKHHRKADEILGMLADNFDAWCAENP